SLVDAHFFEIAWFLPGRYWRVSGRRTLSPALRDTRSNQHHQPKNDQRRTESASRRLSFVQNNSGFDRGVHYGSTPLLLCCCGTFSRFGFLRPPCRQSAFEEDLLRLVDWNAHGPRLLVHPTVGIELQTPGRLERFHFLERVLGFQIRRLIIVDLFFAVWSQL